ncbi:MAG: 4Fe-4S cluster-binding domain-containing protein [Tenacibaculum sp.]|nr:4Fe-4S cluster-binding domain-containing protein [Tenacibaculum sp.]
MKIYKKISKENRRNINPLNSFNYAIIDGKIKTGFLEINVVKHCNLSCRGCSHAAPTIKKDLMDIEKLEKYLTLLSTFFRCKRLRILGGEPLLNPNLETIIRKGRKSNIADKVQIVTNGVLISRIEKEGRKEGRREYFFFNR